MDSLLRVVFSEYFTLTFCTRARLLLFLAVILTFCYRHRSHATDEADASVFSRIMTNHGHVLQPLLPDRHSIPCSLRERSHEKTTLNKSARLNNDDFLKGTLYTEIRISDLY